MNEIQFSEYANLAERMREFEKVCRFRKAEGLGYGTSPNMGLIARKLFGLSTKQFEACYTRAQTDGDSLRLKIDTRQVRGLPVDSDEALAAICEQKEAA